MCRFNSLNHLFKDDCSATSKYNIIYNAAVLNLSLALENFKMLDFIYTIFLIFNYLLTISKFITHHIDE